MIGGPGLSVLTKAFISDSPLLVNLKERRLELNPNSLSKNYNLIFLESPIGSGYSSSTEKSCAKTYKQLGCHICWLFEDIFSKFPNMLENKMFFNGESYCGVQQLVAIRSLLDRFHINLGGVIIESPYFSGNMTKDHWEKMRYLDLHGIWKNKCHKKML